MFWRPVREEKISKYLKNDPGVKAALYSDRQAFTAKFALTHSMRNGFPSWVRSMTNS
ncbi:MAG: hypothetical protein DHS20C04_05890 [Hyphococcus sp.]|nr:MAG: hypothetical protein DHS20C04_05890 [Marinicaulis sp.]